MGLPKGFSQCPSCGAVLRRMASLVWGCGVCERRVAAALWAKCGSVTVMINGQRSTFSKDSDPDFDPMTVTGLEVCLGR